MTKKSIEELFKQGEIDPLVIEGLSLVDEESELGQAFQVQMQGITDQLLEDAGLEKMPIRFMLSTRPELNAGIIPDFDPPVMILNQGVFNKLKTIDQLEGIIAHELGHVRANQKAGKKLSGRGAEVASDFFSGYVLYNAGRDLLQLPRTFQEIAALEIEAPTIEKLKRVLFDSHPSNALRARLMHNGLEALSQVVGSIQEVEAKPIGDTFAQFTGLNSNDHVEAILEQKGFEQASIKDKAEILVEMLPMVTKWRKDGNQRRIADFEIALQSTYEAAMNTDDVMAIGAKVDALPLLQHAALACGNSIIYEYISEEIGAPAFISELQAAVRAFIDPNADEASIEASARDIARIIESNHLAQADLRDGQVVGFLFPEMEEILETEKTAISELLKRIEAGENERKIIPELVGKHGLSVPWNTQLTAWENTQSSEILNALRYLSVADPRLPKAEESDVSPVVPYSTAKNKESRWDITRSNYDLAQAAHAAISGKMIFSAPVYQRELRSFVTQDQQMATYMRDQGDPEEAERSVLARAEEYEKLWLYLRNRDESKATAKTDFNQMETDFWGFVKDNAQWLVPICATKDTQSPFAEKFAEELNKLIERDPETFKPLAYTFFTGRDYDSKEVIPFVQGQENELMSLPALLEMDIHAKSKQFRGFYKPFQNWEIFILGHGNSGVSGHRNPHGIDMAHPFVGFLQDDRHSLFSNEEKVPVLQHGRIYQSGSFQRGDDPAKLFEPSILEAYASDEPMFIADVVKKYGYLEAYLNTRNLYNECQLGEHDGAAYSVYRPSADVEPASVNLIDIYLFEYEALRSLYAKEANVNPRDLVTLISIANHCRSPLTSEVRQRIYSQVINSMTEAKTVSDPMELLHVYAGGFLSGLFSQKDGGKSTWQDLQRTFERRIISGRQPNEYREGALESIGAILDRYADKESYSYNNVSPQFKDWAVKAWAQQHRHKFDAQEELSKDDYARAVVDEVCARFDVEVAVPMLRAFAEALQLQRDAAYYVQDNLETKGLASFSDKEVTAIFSEQVLTLAGSSPEFREAMLTFLCAPFSEESRDEFKSRLESQHERVGLIFGHKLMHRVGRDENEALRLVHDTFSSWPLELQALALDKVIFPVEDKLAQAGGETIEVSKESENILLQVFPEHSPYSRQIRDFFQCYMDTQTEAGQRLITAILMAYKREQDVSLDDGISAERQIGRTLGYVLGRMHPLGAILAQELESYPGTDEDIRKGLNEMDVKAGVDLPDRWTLWHIIDDATKDAPEVLEGKEAKELLGGGSAQLNVRLQPNEGKDEALALLRPFVDTRGKRQYDDLKVAFEAFAEMHPKYAPIAGVIDAAYEKLTNETDYSNSKVQADNAQKLYDGFSVYTDGVEVDFDAVAFKGNGDSWRLYDVAEGVHFKDFSAVTPHEIKAKKGLAKAIVTNGLCGMLRGEAVNSDMHGKQQKVKVSKGSKDGVIHLHVGNFDFGGVALSAPTDEQKQVLGEFLGKVFSKSMVDQTPLEQAVNEVTEEYANTEHTQYIETSKRTLRTLLGDYVNAQAFPSPERVEPRVGHTDEHRPPKRGKAEPLLTNADINAVFYAAMNDKKADKAIVGPMRAEVRRAGARNMFSGGVMKAALGGLGASMGGRTSVTIKDGPSKFASRVDQPNEDRQVG